MLKALRQFFELPSEDVPSVDGKERRLAAAALLVEAATMDGSFEAPERAAIERVLQRHFDMTGEAVQRLIAEAEAEQANSADHYRFTREIVSNYAPDERVGIIEMLWEVIYADGNVDHYESNLMRRIAGLLHVPDRDAGIARQRVLARLGSDGS